MSLNLRVLLLDVLVALKLKSHDGIEYTKTECLTLRPWLPPCALKVMYKSSYEQLIAIKKYCDIEHHLSYITSLEKRIFLAVYGSYCSACKFQIFA